MLVNCDRLSLSLFRSTRGGRKKGVHNVHTLAVGLGRTGAGSGRTRRVFGRSAIQNILDRLQNLPFR